MNVVRLRLANQFLTTSGFGRASEVVRALGAVQAQDYSGAKWALAQRTRAVVVETDIERELSEGEILRTHVLRPTWHFVAPADIRWMLALTAPRVMSAMASYNRKLELTSRLFRRSNDTIAKALAGGRQLTRAELAAALRRARIDVTSGQRLGHLVMQAELDGVICSGARRGKQFTYALLDERVPAAPPLDRDEALLALARRYFSTRGPATAADFAWWSGLTVADAKRGIAMAAAELDETTLGDRPAWLGTRRSVPPASEGTAHLLPNYDEYFIAFKDRSAITRRLASTKAQPAGDAAFAHLVFVDGQLIGSWVRTLEKTLVVRVRSKTRLRMAERKCIEAAADRLGAFHGLPVELRLEAWK